MTDRNRKHMEALGESFRKQWTGFHYNVTPSPETLERCDASQPPITWEEATSDDKRGNSEDHRLWEMKLDDAGFAKMLAYYGANCFTHYPPRSYNEALCGHLLLEVIRRLEAKASAKLFLVEPFSFWNTHTLLVRASSQEEAIKTAFPNGVNVDVEVTELAHEGSPAVLWQHETEPDSGPMEEPGT